MSSPRAIVRISRFLPVISIALALCLVGTFTAAQNSCSQPKDEVFGGYAALFPNGYGDLNYKVNTIPNAFDASNTYYFSFAHNLGFLVDGSGHFNGGTTPRNPYNAGNEGTGVGYGLGGLQYKFHGHTLEPFFRGFVGAANISPDCCGGTRWNVAAGGGGGLDLKVSCRFSIRPAQVDYIYSNYDHVPGLPSTHGTSWNSVRVAGGVVFAFGSYYTPPPPSCTASATPSEVWSGDPVNLTTTGKDFNPKHPLTYGWTTNGGKLSSMNTQAATVDTAGMMPGSYAASSTITDPKEKKSNSATCPATFAIKQPIAPVVGCSASPTTIAIGESSAVTMKATDPQGWPMTYGWSATAGQLTSRGTTATLTATNADAGKTITVTGTASDARASLSASCTAVVNVPSVKHCVVIEDWGECTFEKNPKKPWRVDNDCKDVLDKLSLRLQQMPNGKLNIVGYIDQTLEVNEQTLGAQRSVNVKYYLTTDGPNKADAGRIQPRDGGTKGGKATHFYFVPEGPLCEGQVEEGVLVDETKVPAQSRTAPAPKQHKAKPAAGQ